MKNKKGIGAIFPALPKLYECVDGTFSTSESSRGCSRHGGKKSGIPIAFGGGGSKLKVKDVPISEISVDKNMFQGREKDFSARSVENIVSAVKNKEFVWANLDPITLWKSTTGKLYIISGHSRFEAFRRLSANNINYDGENFNSIPAKVLIAVPLESAQRIALESNTLSTKETDLERAKYYRKLKQDGTKESALIDNIKKNEGKNWVNIYAYTFLNPTGKSINALSNFSDNEDTSAQLTKSLIKWIGSGRKSFPAITNEHEDELYDWLFNKKGYGTGSGAVSNEGEFKDALNSFVAKNTFFGNFNEEKPLNILELLKKSPVEAQYDEQINDAKKLVLDSEKSLKSKIKTLTDRGATKSEIQKIVEPYEATLRNQRVNLQKLLQKKTDVLEYSKNEKTLFGVTGTKKKKAINLNPFYNF